MNTDIHLKFENGLSTEQRFGLRKWIETWCALLSDDKQGDEWAKTISSQVKISGLTPEEMNQKSFLEFLTRQHSIGKWDIRFPNGTVKKLSAARFEVRGEIETFLDGVVTCSGGAKVLIKFIAGKFMLLQLHVEPRIRVVL